MWQEHNIDPEAILNQSQHVYNVSVNMKVYLIERTG